MAKRIRKSDDFYQEALIWMAYRYAIGITEYVGRSGKSEVERYRMFRDIEFDTEEFHALASAFMDFLKRKKITDIVQLRDKYREGEPPFSRWVTTEEYMRHQPGYKGEYDDIFAHAFDALTILSGTQHVVQLKETEQ